MSLFVKCQHIYGDALICKLTYLVAYLFTVVCRHWLVSAGNECELSMHALTSKPQLL